MTNSSEASNAFLTTAELAGRYKLPLNTLYEWRRTGYGPAAIRIGRHLRYARPEVERWERERAAEAEIGNRS